MNPEKKNGRFGTILAYSFMGIVALAFIVGPIIEIFSLSVEVRTVVLIAIALVLFLFYNQDATNKKWEDEMREKEKSIRSLRDENFRIYHKMKDEIRELEKENRELRKK